MCAIMYHSVCRATQTYANYKKRGTMIQMQEKLYSIREAMELLGVSDDTIRRMIKSGELDAVMVRNRWRIRKESLDKYLKPKKEDK